MKHYVALAKDVVLLRYVGIKPVIVHGGGKEISKWMKKLGKDAVLLMVSVLQMLRQWSLLKWFCQVRSIMKSYRF